MIAMSGLGARRLVLRNDLAELEGLAGWIEGWAQQDLSPDLSFAVQLCLEEAVANIIMYSVAKDGRLKIAVEVERKDQTLVAADDRHRYTRQCSSDSRGQSGDNGNSDRVHVRPARRQHHGRRLHE
jgi:hypothetical protein